MKIFIWWAHWKHIVCHIWLIKLLLLTLYPLKQISTCFGNANLSNYIGKKHFPECSLPSLARWYWRWASLKYTTYGKNLLIALKLCTYFSCNARMSGKVLKFLNSWNIQKVSCSFLPNFNSTAKIEYHYLILNVAPNVQVLLTYDIFLLGLLNY